MPCKLGERCTEPHCFARQACDVHRVVSVEVDHMASEATASDFGGGSVAVNAQPLPQRRVRWGISPHPSAVYRSPLKSEIRDRD